MTRQQIERDLRSSLCEDIHLEEAGVSRYRVRTPFRLDDGDHLVITLAHHQERWWLTDEGHTLMHLSYDIDERDLQRGTRGSIITNTLAAFQVEDRDGEFVLPVADARYGPALYSFVQALLRVNDVHYLSRERVRSTFMEDFQAFLSQILPPDRLAFDWSDRDHDPDANYLVDCRINGRVRPFFVFALPSDDKVRDATIALHQFERWGLVGQSVGIYERQEDVARRVVARFSDVCDKQFSTLATNKDRIARYLQDAA